MTWWGLVNPGAGGRNDAASRTRRALSERSIDAEIHVTDSSEHLVELTHKGVEAGHTRFLAVGGDGTVNLIADGLFRHTWESPPILGVLPAGSGSDLVRTFGISQRIEEAADHLLGEKTAPLDVGYLEGPWGDRYFLNSAGIGLTASVVEHADRLPARLGGFRYQIAIWPALIRCPYSEVQIESDSDRFQGEALMIVLSNAQYLAGGMKMAPHADPADGVLNIQVFFGPKRTSLVLKPMVQRGKHLDHPQVRLMTAREFTISAVPEWPSEADGEYLGWGNVRGSVKQRAVRLKV